MNAAAVRNVLAGIPGDVKVSVRDRNDIEAWADIEAVSIFYIEDASPLMVELLIEELHQ